MDFGVVLPRTALGSAPETVASYASDVEAADFDFLLAYDHVLGEAPDNTEARFDRSNPIHEPLVLFGYLAGVTDSVDLMTGVLILPQRQTALVAKQAAEVDVLSDGRLRLGVGVGWNQVEYEALGVDVRRRGPRIEEQVDVLRRLWTAETVTYDGEFHTIAGAGLNPRPRQRPIPVWMGGDADPVLDRVGRLADGWIPQDSDPESASEKVAQIAAAARSAGRDPADLGLAPRVTLHADDREAWVDRVDAWRDLGATHVAVDTMNAGYEAVTDHLAAVREFADRIADAGYELTDGAPSR